MGAATAIVALVVGTTVGHAEATTSSAYGLGAEGAVPIEPTPQVESTDGTPQTSSELQIPDNPLIALEVAKVSAAENTASVELVNFALLPGAELPEQLAPLKDALNQLAEGLEQVCGSGNPVEQFPPNPITDALPKEVTEQLDPQKLCDGLAGEFPAVLGIDLIKVACTGKTGTVEVANLTVLGQPVTIPGPEANTEIPADPLANITINKQTENEDGSFTVEGVVLNVGDGAEVITLGSATCGGAGGSTPPSGPTATPPAPVTTGLPVTG